MSETTTSFSNTITSILERCIGLGLHVDFRPTIRRGEPSISVTAVRLGAASAFAFFSVSKRTGEISTIATKTDAGLWPRLPLDVALVVVAGEAAGKPEGE